MVHPSLAGRLLDDLARHSGTLCRAVTFGAAIHDDRARRGRRGRDGKLRERSIQPRR